MNFECHFGDSFTPHFVNLRVCKNEVARGQVWDFYQNKPLHSYR